MIEDADRRGDAGHNPASSPPADSERLVVVRRDRFDAFAVLAQAYAGERGVRLVWDRRRRERRRSVAARTDGIERRQRDRRSTPALDANDYLVFTRERLRQPGGLAFVHRAGTDAVAACRQTPGNDIRREIDAAAQSDLPVLISGGDAISRRSLARRVHERSGRANRPFRAIDRAAFVALCDEWIADRNVDPVGIGGGTVFLDEVAHWTVEEQTHFSERLERLAGARLQAASTRGAPIRIVSASAGCLIDLVQQRRFDANLFYRLNMIHLVLPSGVAKTMA
ncbi:MAG TPA: sigma 54-interacting transcriptional regulator [Vicinamibacterales bacterium]|nr:sigma 54-interacting transcriptional regulator [Vicinamibacterales bacterium]